MSLINQVLRDLDQQGAESSTGEPAEITPFPVPPSVPERRSSRPVWQTAVVFLLGAAVAGVVVWQGLRSSNERDGAAEPAVPEAGVVAASVSSEGTISARGDEVASRPSALPEIAPVVRNTAATEETSSSPVEPQEKERAVGETQKQVSEESAPATGESQNTAYIPLIVKPDSPDTVVPIKPKKTKTARSRKPVVKSRPARPKPDSFTQAKRFLDAGRLSEAEAALRKTLDTYPKNVEARTLLAGLLLRGGRGDEAGRLLDEGLRVVPDNPDLALLKGRLLMEARDDQAALELLERTLPEGARGMQHLALLGAIYQRQGQHHRALGRFERLLALDPRNASAWAGAGISLDALGEGPRALKAFRKALSLPNLSPVVRRYVQGRFDALSNR